MDVAGRNLSKENASPPSNHQTAATSEMVKMTAMTVQHQHPTNAVDIGSEQDPFKKVAKTAAYGKPGLIIPPDAVRRMDGHDSRPMLTFALFYRVEAHSSTYWIIDMDLFYSLSHTVVIAGGFAALYIVYQVLNTVYTIFFHPLSHVPGPWYLAASRIPYIRHSLNGTLLPWMQALHERYGEIVRYSPNEVSVISGKENPWQEIYGFRTGKQKGVGSFEKDPAWYPTPMNGVPNLLTAPGDNHGRQRRVLSHAFSDRALREQEGLLQSYVDLLISRFRDISDRIPEYAAGGDGWDSTGKIELCKWYNGFTFDVITDLSFGQPFGSLADMKQHLWVGNILEGLKAVKFAYVTHYFPFVRRLGSLIINKSQIQKRIELFKWIQVKTATRVATETQRPDFVTAVMEHQKGRFEEDDGKHAEDLRKGELVSNLGLFLVAGTETTATTLSIGSYFLLSNPAIMEKLKQEVRGRYKSNDEITVDSVTNFEYLNAFIHEVLRYYPPVPAGFMRKVPKTGADVAGVHLSGKGNVSISINQYIANRSSLNFTDPERFVPERWLASRPERYAKDNLAIVQPFSFGPRNCLGKNLAYAELRLVFAKMLFNFDMELDERSAGWESRLQHHTLFYRPDLWVKLTAVTD
ncbi:putative P450 monooxygenase [Aureobasidium pullulans]|nr:putative P450 monooxygenase [Aureobasidium pullulans]